MTHSRKRGLLIFLCAMLVALVGGAFYRVAIAGRILRPYHDSFQRGDSSGWNFYGGSWAVNDGMLYNLSGARGDKAIMGSRKWSDYMIETDIRLNADPADSLFGDVGVVLRVTDPSIGVDSYDGYYVGVGADGSVLLLGRANYSWVWLNSVPLGTPAKRGSWFHLQVVAKGCYFEASTEELTSHKRARLTYFEEECSKRSGAVGVRTYGLPACWKNFSIRPLPD